jgi:hypothetical protein
VRVTWVVGARSANGADRDTWLRIGVEVVERVDKFWLAERLFHYDLVLVGDECSAELLSAIERTQPQAARISLNELDGASDSLRARTLPVLIGAGIAPPRGATGGVVRERGTK